MHKKILLKRQDFYLQRSGCLMLGENRMLCGVGGQPPETGGDILIDFDDDAKLLG
jgi:hypothetical protein